MITRRNFLFSTACVATGAGIGVGTGLLRHAVEAKLTATFKNDCETEKVRLVQIHAREIDNLDNILDKGWRATWSTEDVNLVPDVGDVLQIERTGYVDPTKNIGTLGDFGLKVEEFRVRVISVTEIK